MSAQDDLDDLPPEDADAALAAEYALRVLGSAEHAACARREASDPAFAEAVARWRADLGGMEAAFMEARPPSALRGRVEARLFGPRPSVLGRLWASAGLWRGLTAAAAAAALWFAVPVVQPPPEGARLVSALAPAGGTAAYLAVYDPADGALSLNRTAGEAPPGRSLELWVIVGEAAPVSLGVLPEAALARLDLAPDLAALFEAGALLAVTDEPPGGSPDGNPTGTVQSAGPLQEV